MLYIACLIIREERNNLIRLKAALFSASVLAFSYVCTQKLRTYVHCSYVFLSCVYVRNSPKRRELRIFNFTVCATGHTHLLLLLLCCNVEFESIDLLP